MQEPRSAAGHGCHYQAWFRRRLGRLGKFLDRTQSDGGADSTSAEFAAWTHETISPAPLPHGGLALLFRAVAPLELGKAQAPLELDRVARHRRPPRVLRIAHGSQHIGARIGRLWIIRQMCALQAFATYLLPIACVPERPFVATHCRNSIIQTARIAPPFDQ